MDSRLLALLRARCPSRRLHRRDILRFFRFLPLLVPLRYSAASVVFSCCFTWCTATSLVVVSGLASEYSGSPCMVIFACAAIREKFRSRSLWPEQTCRSRALPTWVDDAIGDRPIRYNRRRSNAYAF